MGHDGNTPVRRKRNGNGTVPGLSWRDNRGPAIEIRWGDVDGNLLASAVDSITSAGSAVILGRTRDGGALSVVVLTDAEKIKEYPSNVADAEHLLAEISRYFSS